MKQGEDCLEFRDSLLRDPEDSIFNVEKYCLRQEGGMRLGVRQTSIQIPAFLHYVTDKLFNLAVCL